MSIKKDLFKCAKCYGIFEKDLTDEEAMKERKDNGWENKPDNEMVLICDDCYNVIMN